MRKTAKEWTRMKSKRGHGFSNQCEILKKKILSLELVEDVGFADLSDYHRVEGGVTPFDFLPDAKIGIVYIARMDKVIEKYGKWYIASLNNFLKHTNNRVVEILKSYGLYSFGVIDEQVTERLIGRISFRQLAVLAGLGTIGKNSCLLHKVHGPNVVIGVVLTNEYLQPDKLLEARICSDCDICLKTCPVRAIENDTFDGHKCKNRRKILGGGCGTPCVRYCKAIHKSEHMCKPCLQEIFGVSSPSSK